MLREKPHGLLKPIETKLIPFHMLTMDFILRLRLWRRLGHGDELFDTIMMVIDKFTKAPRFLAGKNTYTTPD